MKNETDKKGEIGMKVVYRDGEQTKVLYGDVFFEDSFVKVETFEGPVWLGKKNIISIQKQVVR